MANLKSMDNPTTTLEELFLAIVRDSEARPGRRAKVEPETAGSPPSSAETPTKV